MGSKDVQIQVYLVNKNGISTVPSVWVGGKFMGDGEDTGLLHRDGKLVSTVDAVKSM